MDGLLVSWDLFGSWVLSFIPSYLAPLIKWDFIVHHS